MKKKLLILTISAVALAVTAASATTLALVNKESPFAFANNDTNYWYHYEKIEPTKKTHGSKEFWANCSTHSFTLTHPGAGEDIRPGVSFDTTQYFNELSPSDERYIAPLGYTITFNSNGGSSVDSINGFYGDSINEPTKPTKDGYKFTGWSYDLGGLQQVSWPITLAEDLTLYGNWNEKVDIKGYFQSLLTILDHNPYSYIPESMQPEHVTHYTEEQVTYDLNNVTNVSSIKYGGFGEQWHMVIENIKESEKFHNVLSIGETIINTSVVVFNNYLDGNTEDTASHKVVETEYTASIDFDGETLEYSIQYKTNLIIPFFGTVTPQIDLSYNLSTSEKVARIQLSENNAMKYIVSDNSYSFGIEYGVETVSRKAYFQISKDELENITGHIFEYVQYKDKDLIPACADFYINSEYASVVGNKASGLVGFTGYINELYETEQGKLLGYEVREILTILGVTGQYNTLWFNLNNITGINSVKAIENEYNTGTYSNKNPHDIYLNGSGSIFEPAYNKKLGVNTSRKYDVELRKQYFYNTVAGELVEYETNIPMMFIQAGDNFASFSEDILGKSGITASVNLGSAYLNKIEEDYASLIDVLIAHKDDVTSSTIETYIGAAKDF